MTTNMNEENAFLPIIKVQSREVYECQLQAYLGTPCYVQNAKMSTGRKYSLLQRRMNLDSSRICVHF